MYSSKSTNQSCSCSIDTVSSSSNCSSSNRTEDNSPGETQGASVVLSLAANHDAADAAVAAAVAAVAAAAAASGEDLRIIREPTVSAEE